MALTEATSHLNKGLRLIDILPASADRDASELQTRALLSLAWEVYRGWQAPQIVEILLPALPLAQRSGDLKVLARTLWGLWVNPLTQGRISESLQWADELLASARTRGDEEMLLVAHMAEMVTHFWLGDLSQANHHGQAILTRYLADRHAKIALQMNHDPKSLVGLYAANWEWMQGYPDRAKQTMEELSVHSESIGHPFDRAFGLTLGGMVHHYRGEADRWHELLQKAQALGRENNMPFVVDVLVPTYSSIVFVGYGRTEEAVASFRSALPVWGASGLRINAYIRAVFGEVLAMTGDAEAGLEQIDEMLQLAANPDWLERVFLAEILRLKGWMLTLKDDLEGAEKYYLASLDWAREQHAKSWELRTSISLARLWQQQGKTTEARELLAPVYNWFTEGFDTKDLKEAKALLEELAA
jgi:tetratricopeptide (TPR) repeat protein